jgi:LDH2 family malate/lactate/ureidoglycolate dehydrogenase
MRFVPPKNLKSIWISGSNGLETAKVAAGHDKVLIPGDPEREMEAVRMKDGIPVVESVVNELKTLAEKFGVDWNMG